MNFVYIGVIVNTHALKGEVRIISNFEYKDRVFKIGKSLYIGDLKNCEEIETYRVHKNYDMVKFKGINYINDVLKYKGKKVYVLRNDLNLKSDEYLESDLIGLDAKFEEKIIGTITDIINNNGYKLIKIKEKLVPLNDNFIEKVNIEKNEVILKNVGELI